MEPMKRRDALRLGLRKYFTGKPCKHGHICERHVGYGCVECQRLSQRTPEAKRDRALRSKLRYHRLNEQLRKYHRERAHRPDVRAKRLEASRRRNERVRRRRNRLKTVLLAPIDATKYKMRRSQAVKLGLQHYFTGVRCKRNHVALRHVRYGCVECYRTRSYWDELDRKKKHGKDNPGLRNAWRAVHRARKLQATPPWADQGEIKAAYIVAEFFSKKFGEPWHVDHIIPLKGRNVCGLHVGNNLRAVPAVDNMRKHNQFDPDADDLD